MSITYKDIDPESGIRWCVRAVFAGDSYGLDHCLTYGDPDEDGGVTDDPLIEFYDMDSMAAKHMRESDNKTTAYLAEEYGQFVSRYYLSTLLKGRGIDLSKQWCEVAGINLDGGIDRWTVSDKFVGKALWELMNAIEERNGVMA